MIGHFLLLLLPLLQGVAAQDNKKCTQSNEICVTSSLKSASANQIDLFVETTGGAKWVGVNVGKAGMSSKDTEDQCYVSIDDINHSKIIYSDGKIQRTACLFSGLKQVATLNQVTPKTNGNKWSVNFSIPKSAVAVNNGQYGLAWSKNSLGTNDGAHTRITGNDMKWQFVTGYAENPQSNSTYGQPPANRHCKAYK
jgi:hypothetical protein